MRRPALLRAPAATPTRAPIAPPRAPVRAAPVVPQRWLLRLPLPLAARHAGTPACWGTLRPPAHRHVAVHPGELLLLDGELPVPASAPAGSSPTAATDRAVAVLAPRLRVRRAALPAPALPALITGWLAGGPPAPAPLGIARPALYLLRVHAGGCATGRPASVPPARWQAFGRSLRARGDALVVTLPVAPAAG